MSSILIVDDDRTAAREYARMLEAVDSVVVFRDPQRALAWTRRNDPHVVIVNVGAAETIAFIRRLRLDLMKTDTPVLMLTGPLDQGVRHEALHAGTSAFVSKPVEAMELRTYARNFVTARKSRLAAARQAERIRKLYAVASSAGKSSKERLVDALQAGLTLFGLDRGFIARRDVERGLIVEAEAGGDGTLLAGSAEHEFARRVLETRRVLSVADGTTGATDSPSPLGAFVGCPFDVFGEPYGLLAFTADERRPAGFDYADRDFVRLLAALVSTTVESGLQAERLDALAFYDSLTGLPNRNLLNERLERMIVTARRHQIVFAVQYIDLDRFKTVNDTAGHAAGDDVLRAVARRLSPVVRESDTAARLGGDEFIVLQSHLGDRRGADALAERIIAAMREPFAAAGAAFTLGASIGIATYPADAVDAASLLAGADRALYEAKAAGGNTYRKAGAPARF